MTADTAVMISGMKTESLEVCLEFWSDNVVAPNLKTVKDLEMYADLFEHPENPDKGIIYGGPEGWKATEFMYQKMDA